MINGGSRLRKVTRKVISRAKSTFDLNGFRYPKSTRSECEPDTLGSFDFNKHRLHTNNVCADSDR